MIFKQSCNILFYLPLFIINFWRVYATNSYIVQLWYISRPGGLVVRHPLVLNSSFLLLSSVQGGCVDKADHYRGFF